MLSLSFSNKAVCAQIKDTGLHADILLYLHWDTLTAKTLNDPNSEIKRRFVDKLMGILHNVVRNIEKARASCRKRDAVEILQKFRATDKYPVYVSLSSTSAVHLRKSDFDSIRPHSVLPHMD